MTAEEVVDFIGARLRQRPPAGVSVAYLDGFMRRHRAALVQLLREQLGDRLAGRAQPPPVVQAVEGELPEHWTVARRTHANIAAMVVASTLENERRAPTAEERRTLAAYSGWGGLTIEGASHRFPQGFPAPEPRGLIHEFYTPAAVCAEVARVVEPLLPAGEVQALEPSAGIGRFIRAFEGQPRVRWQAVEYSELSARMLAALRPDLNLFSGSFERWVREKESAWSGRLQLVVSNPPYGARGASISEDPNREYREKLAYHYFLRRALDLLAPDGLGVFLVPAGFLTGKTEALKGLREKVLLRHHLAAAFRLPSMKPNGREAIFPGAMLVTDLLFFRSRGGTLAEVHSSDQRILNGEYFKQYPAHLLGKEVGIEAGEDDQTVKPRYGYQVVGEFTRLPDVEERPVCVDCAVVRAAPAAGRARVGLVRVVDEDTAGLPAPLAAAVALGLRVDRYLAAVAAQDSTTPSLLWPELHAALTAWVQTHGNPHGMAPLQNLAQQGKVGAERFLGAFTRAGRLIEGLSAPPPKAEPRFIGGADDVPALAEHLYRTAHSLTVARLHAEHRALGGTLEADGLVATLLASGWFRDGERWDQLVPAADYLTGSLWPKVARAKAYGADNQVARLMDTIQPALFDDIDGVSPRQGWVPLELVASWFNDTYSASYRYRTVSLERVEGLVTVQGRDYADLGDKHDDVHPELPLLLGWINHDKTLFSPPKPRRGDDIDKLRVEKATQWETSFIGWCGAKPERRALIEDAYNKQFKGFVAPSYDGQRLHLARWAKDGPQLRAHQIAGVNRLNAHRGGLLAFDVGVGKTYTGLALLARARQEGWARRPVILVPNSIVWKWAEDIARVLPDYRVGVIGSKRKTIAHGPRKGLQTSEVDSPAERAAKWTRFQAGELDVVLLTYTSLARTRMSEGAVRAYAESTSAIQREVALRQRNAQGRKKLSERDEAILREGVGAWVTEKLELAESLEYDPGILWDDLAVDLLIVDEAQNYKNLYLPEEREGGVPRFMGNPGDGSNRAWQLDFRCQSVRRQNGGAGVVLLSATPAKNSPLELYNLIQYVDPAAWTRLGIRDPEQFIDRYLKIKIQPVLNTSMEVVDRGAVVGFQNLHELRDVIHRYADFKTAEEVGLVLPEARVEMVEVDMDAAQEAKYTEYVAQIEEALESEDPSDKAQILGLLARMSLVAVHPQLDEGYTWRTAATVQNPRSPKFDALVARVLENRVCGHIIFIDNVAAHQWVRMVLVQAGIPDARIAVLNAETASGAADRQRIAKAFNGDPDEGLAPLYDVVIANAIAYEGIDLQTRTCAIHHLDLPWEPATLQQRNGRAVRQGNRLSAISIYYYFARRSQDGLRFNLIQGKRGWMTQLLKSQDRATNNPGAQSQLGPEEILLLISREPEKTRERLEALREMREAEAHERITRGAVQTLLAANARFRRAERIADPAEATRLRGEGEARLKHLQDVPPEIWPWAAQASRVRDTEVVIVALTVPVFEGLRITKPSELDPNLTQSVELGRVVDGRIGARNPFDPRWRLQRVDHAMWSDLTPEHFTADWPEDDTARTVAEIEQTIAPTLGRYMEWPELGWRYASDAFCERIWALTGDTIKAALAKQPNHLAHKARVPVLTTEGLTVLQGVSAFGKRDLTVLPPTASGWRLFMEAAPTAGIKWGELNAAAEWWWGRYFPRGVLRNEGEAVGAFGLGSQVA